MPLAVNVTDYEPDVPECRKCGSDDCEWEQCWQCHGECAFDLHDEDGVNYAPGEEYETCPECNGNGGYLVCHNCQRLAAPSADAGGSGVGT